ncbi:uncharacterized protein TNCV_1126201 [Trichonephila clavipes]|nr:uncharacterized protein TNCV_1126201 [Trichonephila clavipes]
MIFYVVTQLEVSEELGIAHSVISRLWQRFQDDGNVSRCYSTGRPELQHRMRTGIFGSYCQKKQTEHSVRYVSSALFSYRYDSFKADAWGTLVYMLVGLSDVFHLPQLAVACD